MGVALSVSQVFRVRRRHGRILRRRETERDQAVDVALLRARLGAVEGRRAEQRQRDARGDDGGRVVAVPCPSPLAPCLPGPRRRRGPRSGRARPRRAGQRRAAARSPAACRRTRRASPPSARAPAPALPERAAPGAARCRRGRRRRAPRAGSGDSCRSPRPSGRPSPRPRRGGPGRRDRGRFVARPPGLLGGARIAGRQGVRPFVEEAQLVGRRRALRRATKGEQRGQDLKPLHGLEHGDGHAQPPTRPTKSSNSVRPSPSGVQPPWPVQTAAISAPASCCLSAVTDAFT